jgi:hypothetical protein
MPLFGGFPDAAGGRNINRIMELNNSPRVKGRAHCPSFYFEKSCLSEYGKISLEQA